MAEELKPGQKFPTPTPGVGDRVFYETLLRQRPDSAMAQEWCVSYGVLPHKQAKKLWARVMERKKTGKSTGLGSPAPKRSAADQSDQKKKKKKRARVLNEDDGDAGLSPSGGMEHVGKSLL